MYPISNIIYKKSALIGERYVHEYNVKSPRTNKYSKVTVTNNGTKLYGYECDYKNFDNMLTCEHVGADVVIHLDIWWNPQVENQATDRAHRIGQDKNVNVIKIISKGTIEERIIELQEKKKILSDNLIEGKESAQNLTSLTEKDIKQILAYSEEDKN